MKKTPSDTAKCYDKNLDPKGTDYDGDVSTTGEISSERDGTKKMMKNLNIIQISHLTFECS